MNPNTGKHTTDEKPLLLVVDDRFRSLRSLPRLISQEDFTTVWASDESCGIEYLEKHGDKARIIIVDLKSTELGGGAFFQQARHLAPSAAILFTGPLGPFLFQGGSFYECFGLGLKNNINEVLSSISRKRKNGGESHTEEIGKLQRMERFGAIIGRSRGINEIYQLIDKLKTSSSTVLIQGESGVGKELIAQTIHKTSDRRNKPFVAVNCGAIPANLMESELFGHERGAFTTALHQRKGKFEVAEGGTLFLDEISEMEKDLQVKLLRVLQEREFQRVGGNRVHPADVRIMAASSRNLRHAVQSGHFREDLFFRLNVVPIQIPPLRDRKGDIPLLLDYFFEKMARRMKTSPPVLTSTTEKALLDYEYPGNVRELINIVERLIVMCANGQITPKDLPGEVRSGEHGLSGSASLIKEIPTGGVRLDAIEKELILKTLEATGNNKTEAARMLGITRRKIYLRLSSYGIV